MALWFEANQGNKDVTLVSVLTGCEWSVIQLGHPGTVQKVVKNIICRKHKKRQKKESIFSEPFNFNLT